MTPAKIRVEYILLPQRGQDVEELIEYLTVEILSGAVTPHFDMNWEDLDFDPQD